MVPGLLRALSKEIFDMDVLVTRVAGKDLKGDGLRDHDVFRVEYPYQAELNNWGNPEVRLHSSAPSLQAMRTASMQAGSLFSHTRHGSSIVVARVHASWHAHACMLCQVVRMRLKGACA